MKRWLPAASCLLLAAGAGACREQATSDAFSGTGTVMQGVGPECPTTWHVRTDDEDRMLWPVEDPAFQKSGMRVRFSARARPDRMSVCMAGTIVEFLSMEEK